MTDPERRLQLAARTDYASRAERLTARVANRADLTGVVDVVYATVDSPFGVLVVATTPAGVLRVSFDTVDAVVGELAVSVSPRILLAPARLDDARRQLDEYFEGRRRTFDLPLDLQLAGGFRYRVLHVATRIPYGEVVSYGDVARTLNTAARAAGQALTRNPVPILVPCHRVVRSDGALGGYTGGIERKRTLLRLEGSLLAS